MEEKPTTCGQGLAAHAILPEKLGELTDSVAEILELHLETLDLRDENARIEHAAYSVLVESHRRIAGDLLATAGKMAGYRDLPMGRHDHTRLADSRHVEAFRRFVRHEQELFSLLESRLARDRRMVGDIEDEPPP